MFHMTRSLAAGRRGHQRPDQPVTPGPLRAYSKTLSHLGNNFKLMFALCFVAAGRKEARNNECVGADSAV